MKKTFILTLVISLFGIILPLALGVKDFMLIATTFSMVWVIYAIVLLVTVFLIKPGLKIRASRKDGVTMVRYELSNSGKKDEAVRR
jgi:membrane protein implicated in regulation of membrane protease activity